MQCAEILNMSCGENFGPTGKVQILIQTEIRILQVSTKTLVCTFVTSRVDYCNTVLARSPLSTTDGLQWVLNVAARVVSGTGKFNRGLMQLCHHELHWLDVFVSSISLE